MLMISSQICKNTQNLMEYAWKEIPPNTSIFRTISNFAGLVAPVSQFPSPLNPKVLMQRADFSLLSRVVLFLDLVWAFPFFLYHTLILKSSQLCKECASINTKNFFYLIHLRLRWQHDTLSPNGDFLQVSPVVPGMSFTGKEFHLASHIAFSRHVSWSSSIWNHSSGFPWHSWTTLIVSKSVSFLIFKYVP